MVWRDNLTEEADEEKEEEDSLTYYQRVREEKRERKRVKREAAAARKKARVAEEAEGSEGELETEDGKRVITYQVSVVVMGHGFLHCNPPHIFPNL